MDPQAASADRRETRLGFTLPAFTLPASTQRAFTVGMITQGRFLNG